MANMEEAQQKALLSYEMLHGLNNGEAHVQKLLQQDKNHLLSSILTPQVEPLKIPLIQPEANPNPRVQARKKAERNKFIKFVKKIIYFKPKTFWGTQILIILLSSSITGWITAVANRTPKRMDHHPKPPKIEHKVEATTTNSLQVTTDQIIWSLNTFNQLYQLADTNKVKDAIYQDQSMICPTCNHTIQISSPAFYPTTVKCLACNQPFKNLVGPSASLVRE